MKKDLYSGFKKLINFLNQIEELLLGYLPLLLAIVVISFAVSRRVFMVGIPWVEEVSRHTHILIIFLGVSSAVKYGRHITMDTLVTYLKGRSRNVLQVITNLICAAFFMGLFYYSWQYVNILIRIGMTTSTTGIQFFYVYLPISVFSIFIAIRYLIEVKKHLWKLVSKSY
mgnify:CR=1 FL=1